MGLSLSDLIILTSWSLHKLCIFLCGLDPGSYWPTEIFGYTNTTHLGHTSSLVQIIFSFWNWMLTSLSAIVFPLVHGQMLVSAPAMKFELTAGLPEPGPFPGAQPPIGLGQLGQVNRPAACLQWGLVPCCNMAHCLRTWVEGGGFIQEMDQEMGF